MRGADTYRRGKSMKKTVLAVLVLALAGGLGWKIYTKVQEAGKTGGKPPTAAVPVEVTPVAKGSIREIKSFTGTLEPAAQFTVAPKIAGRLEKLEVNIGDQVKQRPAHSDA